MQPVNSWLIMFVIFDRLSAELQKSKKPQANLN